MATRTYLPLDGWHTGVSRLKTSLVDNVIQLAKKSDKFHLAITPEATRRANPNWKRGFYHIAKGAGIPIVLAGIDFSKKTITLGKTFTPSDDIEKDMREIKLFFKDFKGKHPENFSIGDVE